MSVRDWLRSLRGVDEVPLEPRQQRPLVVVERTDPLQRRPQEDDTTDQRVGEALPVVAGDSTGPIEVERLRIVPVPVTRPEYLRAKREARGGPLGEVLRRWAGLPKLRR